MALGSLQMYVDVVLQLKTLKILTRLLLDYQKML